MLFIPAKHRPAPAPQQVFSFIFIVVAVILALAVFGPTFGVVFADVSVGP